MTRMSLAGQPLVSVVIPTRDRALLVRRAIASALAQTLGDLEVLVIDDGSTDDTSAVVSALADRRVRLLRREAPGGAARARNAGIEAARGELVAFLDSDDEWRSTKIERQVERLRESTDPSRTLVYCPSIRHDALTGRAVAWRRELHEGLVFDRILAGWSFVPSVCLVSRSALQAVGGFDETLPAVEDVDLWMRLALVPVHFAVVPDPLAIVHHGAGPHLSADLDARQRALTLLDAKWRPMITARGGPAAYARWIRHKRLQVQRARLLAVRATVASGARRHGWTLWRAMWRASPRPPALLAQALMLLALGPAAYGALARLADARRAAPR